MWPSFRRTLSWPFLVVAGVAHLSARVGRFLFRHLLWDPPRS